MHGPSMILLVVTGIVVCVARVSSISTELSNATGPLADDSAARSDSLADGTFGAAAHNNGSKVEREEVNASLNVFRASRRSWEEPVDSAPGKNVIRDSGERTNKIDVVREYLQRFVALQNRTASSESSDSSSTKAGVDQPVLNRTVDVYNRYRLLHTNADAESRTRHGDAAYGGHKQTNDSAVSSKMRSSSIAVAVACTVAAALVVLNAVLLARYWAGQRAKQRFSPQTACAHDADLRRYADRPALRKTAARNVRWDPTATTPPVLDATEVPTELPYGSRAEKLAIIKSLIRRELGRVNGMQAARTSSCDGLVFSSDGDAAGDSKTTVL